MHERVDNGTRGSPGAKHDDVRVVDHRSVRVAEGGDEAVAVGARAMEQAIAHEERVDRFRSLGRVTANFAHGERGTLQWTRYRQRVELRAKEIAQVIGVLELHFDAARRTGETRETKSR